MKTPHGIARALCSLLAALGAASWLAPVFAAEGKPSAGAFVSLFNGKDLSGWKVPAGDNGHWRVVDGVIDYDARSEAQGNKNLLTRESFGDFQLHVEWRFKRTAGKFPMPIILPDGSTKKDASGKEITIPAPNADSGILLRGGPQANLWCWSVGSGELWSVRKNESLPAASRAAAVPKVPADKPVGEWNSMDITLKGDRATIVLNGQTVIDDAEIPGLPATGPIGLQHHGGPVSEAQREQLTRKGFVIEDGPNPMHPASSLIQFRNLRIKQLDGASSSPRAAGGAATDGFVSLFNGRDLEGWNQGPDKSWVVEDGVITLKREFDGKEHNSDYLWARDIYGDFILELEFKVAEQANSGVFLRTADLKDPVYTGIELQVSNSYGRTNLTRGGTAGAIYDCLAPSRNTVKPAGEWNHYRITCQDNKIAVVLNGEQIVDMDLNQWTEPNKNPDGSKNKFAKPLKDFARKGYVGLQDHGRPVWYRNIKIQKLD